MSLEQLTDAERYRWQRYVLHRTRVDPVTGCWNWQARVVIYGRASTAYNHGLSQNAHKLAYTVFVGPVPEGLQLRHQCHNKPCCNPAHLLTGTGKDNVADNRRDGIPVCREKLTAKQVAEIKRLLALGTHTNKEIGAMFGRSQEAVSHIKTGIRWAHVAPATTPEGN